MRVLGGVVRVGRPVEAAATWATVPARAKPRTEVRERIASQVTSIVGAAAQVGAAVVDPFRILTPDQLWLVYTRVPDVRSAIDSIVRRIATWRFTLEPEGVDIDDPDYDAALETIAVAGRFLAAPNANGETWQELWTKVVTDLLVYEHGVIEEVYDRTEASAVLIPPPAGSPEGSQPERLPARLPVRGAKLAELVAINGASVEPITGRNGSIYGYTQNLYSTMGPSANPAQAVIMGRDQIVSLSLFPNTSGRRSPLIETLVNEIVSIMRASEYSMASLDADEIPPGVLVLSGLAGPAAVAAKADFQNLKGKDQKIRVITNPDPKSGGGATWVEFRRTPKDLAMIDIVKEIRRTIWRIFGVMPIEMGASEDIPRAVGQVQLDVSTSHLVEPLLGLIEAKITARILPLVVGPRFAGRIALRFDREAKLSPDEQKAKAETLAIYVREGVMSRNEARAEIDLDPVEGGDVVTVAARPIPLTEALEEPEEPEGPEGPEGEDPEGEDPEDGGPGEPEPTEPEDGEGAAPGDVGEEGPEELSARPPFARALVLPSAWPDRDLFRGRRTLDLDLLASLVSDYTGTVAPLYRLAMDETLSAVAREYDGTLTGTGAERATQALSAALAKLVQNWSIATEPHYRRTAQSARDRATEYTGVPVVEDHEARADAYRARAIGYLTAPGGLVSDVRAGVLGILAAASADPVAGRAVKPVPLGVAAGAEEGAVLSAVWSVFAAAEHRIDNWSGKLVEMASEVMSAGMAEGAPKGEAGEFYYEWVAVGDDAMCATCAYEGRQGFRPLSVLRVHPGGSTQCRGRCRCVLVNWTAGEVKDGTAVRLSGSAPGNKPL